MSVVHVTMTRMDDVEREAKLRATFPMLDDWLRRCSTAFRPEPGSELEIDDRDWPPTPVSELARVGLVVATDHLRAVRVHIEQWQLFGFAQPTLCRSALLGAAQAVWVLAPDDRAARLKRARTVVAYAQTKHLQYLRGLQSTATRLRENTDIVAAHVATRVKELDEMRDAAGERLQLNDTDMIREAVRATFDDAHADQAVLVWQSGSGAAHGLVWPLLGTAATTQSSAADEQGIAEFQTGGSLSGISNAYFAAFHLADRGWALLRQRGGGDWAI